MTITPPLFLDDLIDELDQILQLKQKATIIKRVVEFQHKLASLTFLDPAAGSGNFLTQTYIELRKLENQALKFWLEHDEVSKHLLDPIQVKIGQFYGIEINDFAVSVAQTALWIAEIQMKRQTEEIFTDSQIEYLPLKSFAHFYEGNALRLDWNEVIPADKLSYIMGNPPFVGAMWSKGTQREDIELVFPECEKGGQVDYVVGWYVKAAKFIKNTNIKCAFVSTNSICQGQQVSLIWRPMFNMFNMKIDFAYQTFRWDSEATLMARVHVVIVGFSDKNTVTEKKIYNEKNECISATNINGYLYNANNFFIEARKEQISNMPLMHMGVMARDGGYLLLDENEYNEYIKAEPQGAKFIRRYMMGKEFIQNIPRYCFWLLNASPNELSKCPRLLKRVEKVKQTRLASKAKETQKLAETPTLFAQLAQPTSSFIAFPKVSSEKRKYIPIGFLDKEIIVGDKLYVIEEVGLFHFGVLTSIVHNAWMRAVAGRLEMRYSYSNTIVYNNFIWCEPDTAQKAKIEQTAQAILDARANYPESSLADLYDELTMPPDLRAAHKANDSAVLTAYGLPKTTSEEEIVAFLMQEYQKRTSKN